MATKDERRAAYAQKLKDPRWQRKRLEVLQRDDYHCVICGDGESTLHVHHLVYLEDDPWDSDERHLVTLCESCHEYETSSLYPALKALGVAVRAYGLTSSGINDLAVAFRQARPFFMPDVCASVIAWAINDDAMKSHMYEAYFEDLAKRRPAE